MGPGTTASGEGWLCISCVRVFVRTSRAKSKGSQPGPFGRINEIGSAVAVAYGCDFLTVSHAGSAESEREIMAAKRCCDD